VGPFGPILGPGRWDRGHTQVESDHLSAYKVACIGQEMDVDEHDQARNTIKKKKCAKLPLWQLIPLSCHNGNLAHIPTGHPSCAVGA
jgi:hypothetical protein